MFENVKRLHKHYTDTNNNKARLDLERWYPELKSNAVKAQPLPAVGITPKPGSKKKEDKDGKKSA